MIYIGLNTDNAAKIKFIHWSYFEPWDSHKKLLICQKTLLFRG